MSTELIIQLAVLQLVIFAVLIFIIRQVMRGHTETAVKRLQKLNEENLRREMELKRKLDEVEKSYKQRLSEAEKVGEKIKETAQKEALETRERIIRRANGEQDEILVEARAEVKEIKAQTLKEMDVSILDKVGEVLRLALSQEFSESLHRYFIDKVIDELVSSRWTSGSFKSQLEVTHNKVLVASPYPLTAEQRKRLLNALDSKLQLGNKLAESNPKINLTEKIEDRHIAGLYLKIGDLLIDGTLSNKINHTIASLKDSISAKEGA